MTTIKATVRGGRIELDEPIDLPDGTELFIPLPNGTDESVDTDRPRTPEEIACILGAMDRMEPLEMTDEELAAWEAARQAQRAWEKAHADEYHEKLRRMWE